MNKCLCCYKRLAEDEVDYHKVCARKIFESSTVPALPYTRADIKELAREIVTASTTVTGVQGKVTLDNEDVTMHMAEAAGIKTVPHSLIRFADGELCYITRRVDRTKKGTKIAMEDMCQLSERLTEDKYKGSYERIARLIRQYSSAPLLDVVNFWEVVLFSWLTGNADMHLKNFSLFRPADNYMLAPAYDLLSTALAMPEDNEELALTLNGKKKRIKREDFEKAMRDSGMDEKAIENLFNRFSKAIPKWHELINVSFLPTDLQDAYHDQIDTMARRISISVNHMTKI